MIIDGKKAAIICILKILEEYTDKEHRLTQQDIINKLNEEYFIIVKRKAVSDSITILQELGYEIDRNGRKGICLLKHCLSNGEVSYLIDAIFSSKSLSANEAKNLSNKVSMLVSSYDRKKYNYIYKSKDVNRRVINDDFFLVISTIEEAIKRKKKLSFKVMDYNLKGELSLKNNGYSNTLYPYYIVNNFGKYYVLGLNYTKTRLVKYRIEHIYFPSVEDEDSPDLISIPGYETFDIAKYINTHIYMFDGNDERITLLLERETMIREVKDWFGKDVRIYTKDDKIYADINACQSDVEFWLLQYCENAKVVSPKELQDSVKMKLSRALESYNNIESIGSKTGIDIYKVLQKAMVEIDKKTDLINSSLENFPKLFKEYLETYISSEHKIELKENTLEVNIGEDEKDKALIVLSFKKDEATDDDFFDLLKGIEKAQVEKANYLETYAVSLVHGLSYYKVKYKTPEAEFFDYKETREISKPIKHGKETFKPLSPVKIKWSSPIDNKMLKFYIIKG